MAGWTSFSDMIAEITTNGKYLYSTFVKTAANAASISSAGTWLEFYTATGIPGAGPQTGAAGTGTQIAQSTQGTGINIGSNVTPDIRNLLTLQGQTNTSPLAGAMAILVDFLVYWPSCVVTGAATTLAAAALPRYTDGKGVMAVVSVQTALGAASPALTLTCTYDDDSSAAAASAITSPQNSAPKAAMFATSNSPFVQIPAGKTGVKAITSYTIASGTTGTVCMFLVKPIAALPLIDSFIMSERDLVVQMPSMPRVYDDAHLGWLVQCGGAAGANPTYSGFLGMGWG